MGKKKYPPLSPKEVVGILLSRGFEYYRSKGDHQSFTRIVRGGKKVTQVDMGCSAYGSKLIKKVLRQTTLTREQFYKSTKRTAKKINCKCADKTELTEWATTS